MYFKDAEAALIVYDITDSQSFEKAKRWVDELNEINNNDGTEVFKFIVGNKCD